MKIIDLSHTINPDMPVYPGTEPPSFTVVYEIERFGFQERKMTFYSHTGTHVDAPAHMIPGAVSVDRFPIDAFVGSACALDLTALAGSHIEVSDLAPHRGLIETSEFVLLNTGWSRFWGTADYFGRYPILSAEAARWLGRFRLKGVGIDAISVDENGSTGFPIHKILLGKPVLIVENLTNLQELTAQRFTFSCLPLKVQEADGSPVRAIALLEFP